MEETALQEYGQHSLVNIEDYAMSADALVKQVGLIQDVMSRVMKNDEHYGTIPGTNKPTLLKPGAEKLCLLFRLNPNYYIIMVDREDFFISYTVKCTLSHIPTGQIIASGVGACNSKETKYRYRYNEETTGQALPKTYWDARNSGDSKEMKRILGGDGFRAAKIDGAWVIAKSERVENDNPYDLDNTLMKMACKRALVAATLNATAASDIFTQDVEDMDPSLLGGNGGQQPKAEKKPPVVGRKSSGAKAETQGTEQGGTDKIQTAQLRAIYPMLKTLGVGEDTKHTFCGKLLGIKALKSLNDLTHEQGQTLITKLMAEGQGGAGENPSDCTSDPTTCPLSGWIEGVAYCGPDGPECPYNAVKE